MRIITRIIDWVTTPYTIYLVLRDTTIPRSVKMRAVIGLVLIFAYVISPVDVIPDFILLSGWIDDLIVVPLGLIIIKEITPGADLVEKRSRAQRTVKRLLIWAVLLIIASILFGLLWLGFLIYTIVKLVSS